MQDHDPTSPRWLLFSFAGRISRRRWWLWSAAVLIGLALYLTAVLRIAGMAKETTDLLVNALLLWPALAISVKRWHDRDKPGWWALIALVPVIGWLWLLIENGLLRGTDGANRFGEEPRRQYSGGLPSNRRGTGSARPLAVPPRGGAAKPLRGWVNTVR